MKYELYKSANGTHFLLLPKEQAEKIITEWGKRVICTINDSVAFHCALMPKKEMGYYITVGKKICKKANIKERDQLEVRFEKDATEHQFEFPEALQQVLLTDEEANRIFNSLTDGNKRSLIQLVCQVKTESKRIERALTIADRLKLGITSPRTILKH